MIRDLIRNTQKNIKNLKVRTTRDVSNSDNMIVSFSNKIKSSEKEIKSFLRYKMYDNKSTLETDILINLIISVKAFCWNA